MPHSAPAGAPVARLHRQQPANYDYFLVVVLFLVGALLVGVVRFAGAFFLGGAFFALAGAFVGVSVEIVRGMVAPSG